MTNIKKINAAIAITALAFIGQEGNVSVEQTLKIHSLCDRLVETPIYQENSPENTTADIMHAIKLIEEYLEEEGV